MGMRSPWATFQPSLRFALLFIANLLILSQLFNWLHDFFVDVYMYPVALTSAELLNALGVAVELDSSMLPRGFCDFLLNGAIYRIIHECTGIFALLPGGRISSDRPVVSIPWEERSSTAAASAATFTAREVSEAQRDG